MFEDHFVFGLVWGGNFCESQLGETIVFFLGFGGGLSKFGFDDQGLGHGGIAHELVEQFHAVVAVVDGLGAAGIYQGLSNKQVLQVLHAEGDGEVFAGFGHWNRIVFFVVDIGQVEGIAEHDAFGDLNLDAHVGADAEPDDGVAFHAQV